MAATSMRLHAYSVAKQFDRFIKVCLVVLSSAFSFLHNSAALLRNGRSAWSLRSGCRNLWIHRLAQTSPADNR